MAGSAGAGSSGNWFSPLTKGGGSGGKGAGGTSGSGSGGMAGDLEAAEGAANAAAMAAMMAAGGGAAGARAGAGAFDAAMSAAMATSGSGAGAYTASQGGPGALAASGILGNVGLGGSGFGGDTGISIPGGDLSAILSLLAAQPSNASNPLAPIIAQLSDTTPQAPPPVIPTQPNDVPQQPPPPVIPTQPSNKITADTLTERSISSDLLKLIPESWLVNLLTRSLNRNPSQQKQQQNRPGQYAYPGSGSAWGVSYGASPTVGRFDYMAPRQGWL